MNTHKLQMLHSSADCDWRTPQAMFDRLDQTFHFDLDLAATGESSLVFDDETSYYLGPDHPVPSMRDALTTSWHTLGKVGYLNPPYSLTLYKTGLDAGVDRAELQWLLIESWAAKAYQESLMGFTTVGAFPYAAQTEWFRQYVMGHDLKTAKANKDQRMGWSGHAALDCWRVPHRVSYLRADGSPAANANVNTCIIIFGPNPGLVGPWSPSFRYWSFR